MSKLHQIPEYIKTLFSDTVIIPSLYGIPVEEDVSQKQKSSFTECDIYHFVCKNIRELGIHKRGMHYGHYKPKAQQTPPSSTPPTQTVPTSKNKPVSPAVSEVVEVACHICKMGFSDGSLFVGHIQVEHPCYSCFCNFPNCYRSFVTRSGLYKHMKQVHQNDKPDDDKPDDDTAEFNVGCGLCYMEFNSEEACDAHVVRPRKKLNQVLKVNIKLTMIMTIPMDKKDQHVVLEVLKSKVYVYF